ncbi:MAG: hypothetical protein ACQEQS_03590 [Thermodesulfobacteriota bacterium]
MNKINGPEYNSLIPSETWRLKAGAFVIRAAHQLWGKKNEDIIAWIFEHGFKNSFVKDHLFGINRKPMSRPAKNWGIDYFNDEKINLPPGITIPYIKNKNLLKVFIYSHEGSETGKVSIIEGSSTAPVILSNNNKTCTTEEDLIQGYLLFQEKGEKTDVIIPDYRLKSMDEYTEAVLRKYENLYIRENKYSELNSYFKSMQDIFPDSHYMKKR